MYEPDRVLEHLLWAGSQAELLMGDNLAPAEGGWVNGQPQSGLFKPYTVLMLMQSSPTDGFCEPPKEWVTQFSVRHYGASRAQLSRQANTARVALLVPWVDGQWRSMRMHWESFGSVQRVDSTDPPFWQCYDALTVQVSSA